MSGRVKSALMRVMINRYMKRHGIRDEPQYSVELDEVCEHPCGDTNARVCHTAITLNNYVLRRIVNYYLHSFNFKMMVSIVFQQYHSYYLPIPHAPITLFKSTSPLKRCIINYGLISTILLSEITVRNYSAHFEVRTL